MNLHRLSFAVVLAAAVLAVPVLATDLGDDAPPLKVEKWIKGGPIDLKDGKGKSVYVIEFWATWCAPCRASIPHLTKLQQEFKDKGLVVIGVSVDKEAKRNTRKDVEPFVETMGEKMAYTIALDDTDAATQAAYMDAFIFDGIPTAFIVDKAGKVVWAGQAEDEGGKPSWANLDKAVKDVLEGKYDLKAAQKDDKERRVVAEKQRKVRKSMSAYFELVSASEKPEGAEKAGQEAFAAIGEKDGEMLNEFAWKLLTDEGIKFRDLKLALKAGKAAYDASEGKNAAIADTYARALWDNGEKGKAIEMQKKAVKLAADDDEMRKELEETLKGYEKAVK